MKKISQMISTMQNLTGPLGPIVSFEQRLTELENWHKGLVRDDIQSLNAILAMPENELEVLGIDSAEAYVHAAEALASLGDRFLGDILYVFTHCLAVPHLTTIILDALGNWGDPKGIALIETLLDLPA